MICPACRGTGRIRKLPPNPFDYSANPLRERRPRQPPPPIEEPCPECNGSGIASCCDAAGSAQPEPEDKSDD